MAHRLNASQPDFEQKLRTLLDADLTVSAEVNRTVEAIIQDIRDHGDKALFEYTNRFDNNPITAKTVRVSPDAIDDAYKHAAPETIQALEHAAKRIEDYHQRQLPEDLRYEDGQGNTLGWKWTPLDAVGLYVPGGRAAYMSSVLMNAIPARVAGVKRMAMVVPAPEAKLNNDVLAAAKISGITEIYTVGGAQAVAALAYGTDSIAPVDKIVGPGNAYVAAAKRQVFGKVGIDMIAGPSEILVIADEDNNPEWIATDLLSQAEHDEAARAILVTDSNHFAEAVIAAVETQLETLPRKDIARQSWNKNGIVIIVDNLEEAARVANLVAPEHLELCVCQPEVIEPLILHAGAIFMGKYTPEAIGDYIAGPSHVLPTSGTARFASGLSVFDFIKRSSIISCERTGFHNIAQDAEYLALQEGLGAHSLSITVRK